MRLIATTALLIGITGSALANEEPSIKVKLESLCDQKLPELETLSRKASLLVKETYEGKKWTAVAAELKKAGLNVPKGSTLQHHSAFTIPIRKKAFKSGGYSFDLHLEFTTNRGSKKAFEGVPDKVTSATAKLLAVMADETDEIAEAELFGAKSVLTRLLQSEVRRNRDGDFKVLRKIELSYELIRHHREAEFPFGYHVRLLFSHAPQEDAGKSAFFTVTSQEDLPRNLEGKPVKNWQGWQNTHLADIHFWGGSEWTPAK